MDSPYECEVRYFIDDIESYQRRLDALGVETLYSYEFTDYYYHPLHEKWNPVEKNLRIRHWLKPSNPTAVLFCKNEVFSDKGLRFKRAVYKQGKIPLFTGDMDECKTLLSDLGFQPWIAVAKKEAKLLEIPSYGTRTAVEFIDGLGWIGELEVEGSSIGDAARLLRTSLGVLEIDLDSVDFRPISAIVSDTPGFRSARIPR